MSSRDKILAAVKMNQPPVEALPALGAIDAISFSNREEKFKTVLEGIGGALQYANSLDEVAAWVHSHFAGGGKFVSTIPGMPGTLAIENDEDAHLLEDVEAAVIEGAFAVAENAAIWATASALKVRALPFICQHLLMVLRADQIVNNMHEAYDKIAADQYDFGVFIAGPSKTADIEQSLVLGAHGPKTITVFLLP